MDFISRESKKGNKMKFLRDQGNMQPPPPLKGPPRKSSFNCVHLPIYLIPAFEYLHYKRHNTCTSIITTCKFPLI